MKEIKDDMGNIIITTDDGIMHSFDDKPAMIDIISHCNIWYKNGKLHRTKGPAIISFYNDTFVWFYEGNNVTNIIEKTMGEGKISSDWENWSEEDEFLFVLLVS